MANNTVQIHVTAKDDASRKIDGTRGSVEKLSKAAKVAFAGAAVGAAGFGIAAVKSGMQFESSMSEVKTLIPQMDDGTFEKLSKDLRNVSKDFGNATSDSVPALYQALSAGVPADNVIQFMETASKAAAGGVTNLETAVNGITTVVNSYGKEQMDAATASNIMFSAVKDGKTTFEELSSSLATVLPTASSLGVSFEEVSASVALMTSQGAATATATAGLRQMLVEATKGGTSLDKAIKSLTGKSMAALIKDGETASGVMQQVRESMPDQEFRDLFGSVEASGAALMLTGDKFEQFEGMLGNAQESAGALDAAFGTVSDTAKFKFDKSMAGLQDRMLEVGVRLLPLMVAGMELLDKVIVALGPILTDMANALKSVAGFLKENKEIVGVLLGMFAALKVAAVAQAVVLYAQAAATTVATTAMAALNAVMAVNPFTLVVLAIGALVVAGILLWKNWDTVTEKAKELWKNIKKIFGDISDAFLKNMGAILTWLKDHWSGLEELIKLPFLPLIILATDAFGLRTALKNAFDKLKTEVWNIIKALASNIDDVLLGVVNGFIDLGPRILRAMDWARKLLVGAGKDIIRGLIDGLTSLDDMLLDVVKNLAGKITGGLGSVGSFLWGGGDKGGSIPIPGMASGGIVKARPGGTLARLGEGGRDEAVIPLGRNGGSGIGTTVVNNYINIDGIVTDPVETGQQIADVLNRASIITGPLVMSTAVE